MCGARNLERQKIPPKECIGTRERLEKGPDCHQEAAGDHRVQHQAILRRSQDGTGDNSPSARGDHTQPEDAGDEDQIDQNAAEVKRKTQQPDPEYPVEQDYQRDEK